MRHLFQPLPVALPVHQPAAYDILYFLKIGEVRDFRLLLQLNLPVRVRHLRNELRKGSALFV